MCKDSAGPSFTNDELMESRFWEPSDCFKVKMKVLSLMEVITEEKMALVLFSVQRAFNGDTVDNDSISVQFKGQIYSKSIFEKVHFLNAV